jgi:hypothetical protein
MKKRYNNYIKKEKINGKKATSSFYYNEPLLHRSGVQYFERVRELHTMEENLAIAFLDCNKFELASSPTSRFNGLIWYV